MATKKVKKSLVSSFLCLLTPDIVPQIIESQKFRVVLGSEGCKREREKNPNYHKYATFEAIFLCFYGQKIFFIFFKAIEGPH